MASTSRNPFLSPSHTGSSQQQHSPLPNINDAFQNLNISSSSSSPAPSIPSSSRPNNPFLDVPSQPSQAPSRPLSREEIQALEGPDGPASQPGWTGGGEGGGSELSGGGGGSAMSSNAYASGSSSRSREPSPPPRARKEEGYDVPPSPTIIQQQQQQRSSAPSTSAAQRDDYIGELASASLLPYTFLTTFSLALYRRSSSSGCRYSSFPR